MAPDDSTLDLVSGVAEPSRPVPGVAAVFGVDRPLLIPLPIGDGELVLGRDAARGLVDDRLSRRHAAVRWAGGRFTVSDLDSRNGVFVDGARVEGPRAAVAGQVIRLASTLFTLVDDVGPLMTGAVTVVDDQVAGPRFAAALARVRAATGDALLVSGETGVGKELAARAFHATRGGPLVAVNCAAIPAGLAERLLFGTVRGAFTDATRADGYLTAADGGVLFLDEVGELDLAVQAKLLRVLETREVVPLGATEARRVDVRFCFATLRNLRSAVADGRFRADLYYRIARDEVRLPSLRERPEEIPWLVDHELARRTPRRTAHPRLVEACLLRPWPGNVRELRAAVAAATRELGPEVAVVRPEQLAADAGLPDASAATPAPTTRPGDVTRDQLAAAIAEHHGNLAAVARALGLHRSQLYRLLAEHGLSRDTPRS